MGQTLLKPTNQSKSLKDEIVIQITKKQILKFLQFVLIISMLFINVMAIKISSPFIKELFVSQAILLLIFFIKNSKSNNILNN